MRSLRGVTPAQANPRTTNIGTRRSAENLQATASPKHKAHSAASRSFHFRQVLQKKYTAPNMNRVTPTSVVTSPLCAMKLGSRQNRDRAINPPAGPKRSRAQRKINSPSSTPNTTIASRAALNRASALLRKSSAESAAVPGTRKG